MAEKPKRQKRASEEAKKRKRERNREKAKTRVELGIEFVRWRLLKDKEGCKSDSNLATLLLDCYNHCQTSTQSKTPPRPPTPPVSNEKEESNHGRCAADQDPGVQPLPKEGKVVALETRTVGVKMEEEMTVNKTVLDFETPVPSKGFDPLLNGHRVETEDDLIDKRANITYNENLLSLAKCLRLPVQKCNYVDKLNGQPCPCVPPFQVVLKPRGTGVILDWRCPFDHQVWSWNSQPTLKLKMQGGDFMLSTNILLSGSSYSKVALLFKFMQMGMVARSTFFQIQDSYCKEPILKYWEQTRAEVIERLRHEDGVVLLGDGRMDFPDRCANFCTYTTIEQESRDIVHIDSADQRTVGGSSVVLEESFCRSMDALLPDLRIKEIVTDAHPQITALLHPRQGKYTGCQHSLDVWRAAKSLSKKLRRSGAKKHKEIRAWTRDIVHHFWYCSQRAQTEEQFKTMWVGVLYHVSNKHSWATGRCEHGPLAEGRQDKPWFTSGSRAHRVLIDIVLQKELLTQVKKLINFRSTSDLESFQNLILKYAPKSTSYTLDSYKTRTCLAAIDYNKHKQHKPAQKIYKKVCNKRSTWRVCPTKEKSYSYIPEIQTAILANRLRGFTGLPSRATVSPGDPGRQEVLTPAQPAPASEPARAQARGETGDCVNGAVAAQPPQVKQEPTDRGCSLSGATQKPTVNAWNSPNAFSLKVPVLKLHPLHPKHDPEGKKMASKNKNITPLKQKGKKMCQAAENEVKYMCLCGKLFSKVALELHQTPHDGEDRPFGCPSSAEPPSLQSHGRKRQCHEAFNVKGSGQEVQEKSQSFQRSEVKYEGRGEMTGDFQNKTSQRDRTLSCGEDGNLRYFRETFLNNPKTTNPSEESEVRAKDEARSHVKAQRGAPLDSYDLDEVGETDFPFSCDICGCGFSWLPHLYKHRKKHTAAGPFWCPDCGRTFRQSRDLRTHLCVQTGTKPYSCSVCKESFFLRNQLYSHMTQHKQARKQALKQD